MKTPLLAKFINKNKRTGLPEFRPGETLARRSNPAG